MSAIKGLATVFLFSIAFSHVSAAAAGSETPNFESLLERAQTTISNVSSQVFHVMGLPDKPEANFFEIVSNSSKALGANINEFIEKAQQASSSPDSPLAGIIGRLNETATSLTTPQLQEKAKHLHETFLESLNTIVAEARKVAKEVNKEAAPESDLGKFTKKTVEQTIQAAKQFEEKVQQALNKPQAA